MMHAKVIDIVQCLFVRQFIHFLYILSDSFIVLKDLRRKDALDYFLETLTDSKLRGSFFRLFTEVKTHIKGMVVLSLSSQVGVFFFMF
jgi:hypothetical protein